MHPKLKELIAFVIASGILIGTVILCGQFTTPAPNPRGLLEGLTDDKKRRLALSFRLRRRAAIAALASPLVLLLVQTVFGEKVRGLLGGSHDAPLIIWIGTLALFAAGVVAVAFVYRCPLCRITPTGIMAGTGTFGYSGQSHKGLDLFPNACKNCGLNFKPSDPA